jgi:hypothetical protein
MQVRVSPLRLNLLRGGYLLLIAGLGPFVWPELLGPVAAMPLQRSVVVAMLCALSLLSLLGLRYPLRMLPLLIFEMAWKSIWLAAVALRLWLGHRLDAGATEMTIECLVVVFIFAVTPWDYLSASLIRQPSEAWRRLPNFGEAQGKDFR